MPGRQLFAKDLKAARKNAGLTQAQLAQQLGVEVGSISGWERANRMPSEEHRRRVAQFLGISEADFLLRYAITGHPNGPAPHDGEAGDQVREQAAAGRRLGEELLEGLPEEDRELLERLARRLGGAG